MLSEHSGCTRCLNTGRHVSLQSMEPNAPPLEWGSGFVTLLRRRIWQECCYVNSEAGLSKGWLLSVPMTLGALALGKAGEDT